MHVDAAVIHSWLPRHLQVGPKAISVETVRLRLADDNLKWTEKAEKGEVQPKVAKARLEFCRIHGKRTKAQWLNRVQLVADFKDFTWYPPNMAKKVKKHAEKYAYMREGEKYKPGASRPRPGRMFNKKQYQKAKKVIACERSLRLGRAAWFQK